MTICAGCPLHRVNGTQPLTPRQAAVLRAIAAAIGKAGVGPSHEEIRVAIGVRSISTVAEHLDTLVTKGYVTREFTRSHSLRLTPAALAWLETFTPTEPKP